MKTEGFKFMGDGQGFRVHSWFLSLSLRWTAGRELGSLNFSQTEKLNCLSLNINCFLHPDKVKLFCYLIIFKKCKPILSKMKNKILTSD